MMLSALKWFGLLPAAGGLLGQLFDLEFMKTLDLLHGFGGVTPHIVGIFCFGLARLAAANQNKQLSAADADRSRTVWGWSALVLFVLFLGLVSVTLPEDLSSSLIEWRWRLAAVLYILFYAALGKSEPPL